MGRKAKLADVVKCCEVRFDRGVCKLELISNLFSVKTKNRRPNLEQLVAWGLNRDYDYNALRNFYQYGVFKRTG